MNFLTALIFDIKKMPDTNTYRAFLALNRISYSPEAYPAKLKFITIVAQRFCAMPQMLLKLKNIFLKVARPRATFSFLELLV